MTETREKYDRLISDKKYEIADQKRTIEKIKREIKDQDNLFKQILRVLSKNKTELALATSKGCVKGSAGRIAGCGVGAAKEVLVDSFLSVIQNYREEKESVSRKLNNLKSDRMVAEDMIKYLKHQKYRLERERDSLSNSNSF